MSRHMLSDDNTINDFNPYVMGDFSLPGAIGKPQPFGKFPVPVQENGDKDETSPICDYGITSGWRTIDMCRPPEPNCSLSRPLLPGRNIDRGFTANVKKVFDEVKKSVEKTGKHCGLNVYMLIIIVLILLIAVL